MPSKGNEFNWDEIWRQEQAGNAPEQGFDFGNIAICERCGVTMPANEAQMIPRTIYTEHAGGADTVRTSLVVCPRCVRAVVRKNRWLEIRHWLLLAVVGLICALVILRIGLYLVR